MKIKPSGKYEFIDVMSGETMIINYADKYLYYYCENWCISRKYQEIYEFLVKDTHQCIGAPTARDDRRVVLWCETHQTFHRDFHSKHGTVVLQKPTWINIGYRFRIVGQDEICTVQGVRDERLWIYRGDKGTVEQTTFSNLFSLQQFTVPVWTFTRDILESSLASSMLLLESSLASSMLLL